MYCRPLLCTMLLYMVCLRVTVSWWCFLKWSSFIFQLTYADTHPMFTEKSFPHFFRVVPSDNEFNPPRLSIMRYYDWTRVGTLYQNEAKYALVKPISISWIITLVGLYHKKQSLTLSQAHNNLVSELEKNNFTIVESQSKCHNINPVCIIIDFNL